MKPYMAFRSAIRFTEPRPVKKGFSVRWDFDVRWSNSDKQVTYGHRVVGRTAEAAIRLATKEALNHSDELAKI
jgi:hypothetical protein